ncbi:hypothetical protein [Mucisphaera sp.]|uniref:hypothetical protein n=1 Tax=Mucisphaera sp. TaxID=2913024 RepID=UPI003D1387DD
MATGGWQCAAVGVLAAFGLLAGEAGARTVAIYAPPSVSEAEVLASPVSQLLAGAGDELVVFDSLSAEVLGLVLGEADLLVLDQHAGGRLITSISGSAVETVRGYVDEGGGLLAIGNRLGRGATAINLFFGSGLRNVADTGIDQTELRYPFGVFEGGPETVLNDTGALVNPGTLAANELTIYGVDGASSVVGGFFGAGAYMYLGIDGQSPLALDAPVSDVILRSADFAVDATVIPLPVSAWAGLCLLSGMVYLRRTRG